MCDVCGNVDNGLNCFQLIHIVLVIGLCFGLQVLSGDLMLQPSMGSDVLSMVSPTTTPGSFTHGLQLSPFFVPTQSDTGTDGILMAASYPEPPLSLEPCPSPIMAFSAAASYTAISSPHTSLLISSAPHSFPCTEPGCKTVRHLAWLCTVCLDFCAVLLKNYCQCGFLLAGVWDCPNLIMSRELSSMRYWCIDILLYLTVK